MLEEKDLQSIGELIDKRLGVKLKENNKVLEDGIIKKFDKKFDEILGAVNDGFTGMQKEFDGLRGELNGVKEDIKLRPTKKEIFEWADRRIVDLELAKDRHDFMHINELGKLPPQPEISRALVERGFKRKTVQHVK
ncbi:MAG: hypothetical protein Q7K35_01230 [bacterium]|nr:hypothetical protein [bacterium]